MFVTVNILLLNLNICNMQQTVSLWRKRNMNYIEVSTLCVFTSGTLGNFLNARFSSSNWFVGTLEAHLITIEVFWPYTHYIQHNRPFSNTEIHWGWPCFLPTFWCYVNLVTNFSLQFNIWCPCSTSQRRKNSWVSSSNY